MSELIDVAKAAKKYEGACVLLPPNPQPLNSPNVS